MENHVSLPTPPPSLRRPPPGPRVTTVLLAVTLCAVIAMLTVYALPTLMLRWWLAGAQAEANAAYLKRQAELKAESEAADQRLQSLDGRVQLVSLGFREVAKKVAPSVVNIRNEVEIKGDDEDHGFFDFETRRLYVEHAEGSGILVKPGLVLTNHHVIRDAQRLRVVFASGAWVMVKPESVTGDPLTDLAVIRLPENEAAGPSYAVSAEFADSDKDVQVGDWALAVGSPFGLKQSVSVGVVSGKGRVGVNHLDWVELIQTDASINPGSSGGPLFDQLGRVIGINVAIASKSGSNQGVGFAIPSNTAKEILEQLVEKGEVVRGFLGITMQDLTADLEHQLKVNDTGGVYVTTVRPGTPAYEAGLRSGDIIVRYNGSPVGTPNAVSRLRRRIAATEPNTSVPIEVVRGKRRVTVDATLSKRDEPRE